MLANFLNEFLVSIVMELTAKGIDALNPTDAQKLLKEDEKDRRTQYWGSKGFWAGHIEVICRNYDLYEKEKTQKHLNFVLDVFNQYNRQYNYEKLFNSKLVWEQNKLRNYSLWIADFDESVKEEIIHTKTLVKLKNDSIIMDYIKSPNSKRYKEVIKYLKTLPVEGSKNPTTKNQNTVTAEELIERPVIDSDFSSAEQMKKQVEELQAELKRLKEN
ncbi:hypothetical protein Cri9333_4951 (plasmid) [Crinalium epipsammum PCC 9333]|uniref:Uncharacterized protein n=1 Tax=Crinalium epipsammum PCC 9333 TaxID=1173022 RepID=K9W7J3_9CYAN|nr:hypothetical protein [Crinalium epipsammum]AFZ15707.1 hypothetical protein Cri9333_4951 [Crinalium epipsammum PCC 9333]